MTDTTSTDVVGDRGTGGRVTYTEPDSSGIAHIELDRPHKANSLSCEMVEQLLDRLRLCHANPPRALVIDGATRHFSAGFDFKDAATESEGNLIRRFLLIEQALQMVRHAPFLTICRVRGAAVGAGADLAVACTYRIGGPDSYFRFPGWGFGVALGTRHLVRLIGKDRTRDLLLSGRRVSASEALHLGLLNLLDAEPLRRHLVENLVHGSQRVDPPSLASLLHTTETDSRDADMSALVSSLLRPGLHERIEGFLAHIRESKEAPPTPAETLSPETTTGSA